VAGNVDDEVRLEDVLMFSGDNGITIGTPNVAGHAVRATIVEQTKGEKITVFKFKSKKRYRKTRGHRSQLTILKVEEILQG
jgi:large subunit ribosomal protein L21